MDHAAGHHVLGDPLGQRAQQPGDMAEPFGKLTAIDVDATAGIDLGLPIEGRWSQNLDVTMCARKLAPAMPRGIGSSGIGACIIASHLRHEQAGRTCRTTSKRPGTYSNTSVTLSPTWRSSVPPQALQHVGRRMHDVAARQLGR